MGAVDAGIADEIISNALDVLRLESGTRARVLALLEQLRKDLVEQLRNESELTAYTKDRINTLLRQASKVIDEYYVKMQGDVELTLQGVGRLQAQQIVHLLDSTFVQIGASLPTKTFLERLVSNIVIQGAPSAEWWSRQNQDVAFRFANAVRQGLVSGETNEQIVRRITGGRGGVGIMDIAARNARALVHSSVQTVANAARRETFMRNADVITGIQQLSTLDNKTTPVCIAYSGAEWSVPDLEPINDTSLPYNGGVPRHWGCRSVEVPITKTFAELGIDLPEPKTGTRASADGPVPADTTFDQWLSRRTPSQQDAQLGPGRAQLFRDGKISLADLLDFQGHPLSLAQLEQRFGA